MQQSKIYDRERRRRMGKGDWYRKIFPSILKSIGETTKNVARYCENQNRNYS